MSELVRYMTSPALKIEGTSTWFDDPEVHLQLFVEEHGTARTLSLLWRGQRSERLSIQRKARNKRKTA